MGIENENCINPFNILYILITIGAYNILSKSCINTNLNSLKYEDPFDTSEDVSH